MRIKKLRKKISRCCVIFVSVFIVASVHAKTYPLPPAGTDVIGQIRHGYARGGESIADVGRRFDIGVNEMLQANPGISPDVHLQLGQRLLIPSRFILPPGPRQGIVINLAELRLYYFPDGENTVMTVPVGIGREGGWQTPTGTTKIVSKQKDPVWRPTANVRAEAAANGTPIPKIFPPGPDNPLGGYAMRLGWSTYLMHGTNRPKGVGARVSAGCIRMYPEDIEQLFHDVPVGTLVRVINSPFKTGWLGNKLLFEAHRPLREDAHKYDLDMAEVVHAVKEKSGENTLIRWSSVKSILQNYNGLPHEIGSLVE